MNEWLQIKGQHSFVFRPSNGRAASYFTDVPYGLPAHGFLADWAGTETRGQASAAPATRPPCFSRSRDCSAEGAELSEKGARDEAFYDTLFITLNFVFCWGHQSR